MMKKTYFIVSGLLFWIFLIVPLFFGNSVETAWAATEGWESAPMGTYSPADEIPGFIADIGAWLIDDTVSGFPEDCGSTPHYAEILMWEGSKALRLNSVPGDLNGCADNIWAVLFTELHFPGIDQSISIPITSSTNISFKESGSLAGMGTSGWGGGGCPFPPCYKSISLSIEDTRGNIVAYVLQRDSSASPDTKSYYKEIWLDPDAKTYNRNLFNDFNQIYSFNPSGASIRAINFVVSDHGSATIDDIVIGAGGINYSIYDTNQDCIIGDFELLDAIDLWVNGSVGDFELLDLIDVWVSGSYC